MHYLWWLASRASGVVALVLISLSVLMGLAMAARVLRRPSLKRTFSRLHQHVAITALCAIAVHGLTLLGDPWLHPGIAGLAIPFRLAYRPQATGLGIIAGYLAAIVGPSFYIRRRLGAGRWRKLHRLSALVWVLSAIHTLGSGSDAGRPWLRALVLAPVMPLAYLLVQRALRGSARPAAAGAGSAARPVAAVVAAGAGGAARPAPPIRSPAPLPVAGAGTS